MRDQGRLPWDCEGPGQVAMRLRGTRTGCHGIVRDQGRLPWDCEGPGQVVMGLIGRGQGRLSWDEGPGQVAMGLEGTRAGCHGTGRVPVVTMLSRMYLEGQSKVSRI